MIINPSGYVTIPVTDLVIITGISKKNEPYTMIKIDGNQSFRYASNPHAVKQLQSMGVKTFTPKHEAEVATF